MVSLCLRQSPFWRPNRYFQTQLACTGSSKRFNQSINQSINQSFIHVAQQSKPRAPEPNQPTNQTNNKGEAKSKGKNNKNNNSNYLPPLKKEQAHMPQIIPAFHSATATCTTLPPPPTSHTSSFLPPSPKKTKQKNKQTQKPTRPKLKHCAPRGQGLPAQPGAVQAHPA